MAADTPPKTSWTRILFRCAAYPFLAYICVIYAHAKYNDPEGFKKIAKVFTFNFSEIFAEWNAPIQKISHENDQATGESSNEQTWQHFIPDSVSDDIGKSAIKENCTIKDDLIEQRENLMDLAMKCIHLNSLLSRRGLQKDHGKPCFSNFTYTDRAQNISIISDVFPFTVPVLTTFKEINQKITTLMPKEDALKALENYKKALETLAIMCGNESCVPLAEIIYEEQSVSQEELNTALHTENLDKAFESLEKQLTSKVSIATQARIKQISEEQEVSSQAYLDTFNVVKTHVSDASLTVHENALKTVDQFYKDLVKFKVIPEISKEMSKNLPPELSTNIQKTQ